MHLDSLPSALPGMRETGAVTESVEIAPSTDDIFGADMLLSGDRQRSSIASRKRLPSPVPDDERLGDLPGASLLEGASAPA